mgnify:CR=1 FL=1
MHLHSCAKTHASNLSSSRSGKSASGLKEVADSFTEGLAEGNVEAEKLKTAAPDEVITAKVEEVKKEL